ncbi:MAG TPA: hypothetical protein VM534_07930 [Thermoanaerobaculia bacterium]|nr:hypothetical protein [Thermoanaerobaculia bacterium]
MEIIPIEEVMAARERLAAGRRLAAERFSALAARGESAPEDLWREHFAIQAAAILETARYVSLPPHYRIHYRVTDEQRRLIEPFIGDSAGGGSDGDLPRLAPERSFYPFFELQRVPAALLEYWFLMSEMTASPAWAMTRLIATGEEYDDALRRMSSPQLVRPLIAAFLPAAEISDAGGRLDVTLYTRADEERIERRTILLDTNQELQFHGRELIAEGRGGVPV